MVGDAVEIVEVLGQDGLPHPTSIDADKAKTNPALNADSVISPAFLIPILRVSRLRARHEVD